MAVNMRCPKCGSTNVQLSNEMNKHGCLFIILFGWVYLIWILIKWLIGVILLVCVDWWAAIIKAVMKKGHVWQCRRWFSNRRKICYCHDCGHNFRA